MKTKIPLVVGLVIAAFTWLSIMVASGTASADISQEQRFALEKLASKVAQEGKTPRAEQGASAGFKLEQLAYVIIYMEEKRLAGPNAERLFDAIISQIGHLEVRYDIMFADERSAMLQALAEDVEWRFAPDSKIVFSPIPSKYLGRRRTLGALVSETKSRLRRETGYQFKSDEAIFYQ